MASPANASAPDLQPGTRHVATIRDVAFGGEGVARLGEFVVFVPFVAEGEEVELELVEVKKHFGRGRLVRVLRASPHRVEPRCRYFGACGGCQYQHLEYAEQLRVKERQVRDVMHRLGGFACERVAPVVPCPRPYGYRNRLMLRSQWNKAEQRLMVGFLRHDNRWVVDVEECAIAEPMLNEQIGRVRASPPARGGLKVVVRSLPEGWEVPADSFFQNNLVLLPDLVMGVRERLQASGVRHLLDIYCGVGFFALELSDVVERWVGVEYDQMAVRAAKRNAAARGVTNGEFLAGAAEECLGTLLGQVPAEDTAVILDPPRTGCRPPAIAALRAARAAQVLYVSCHPATLARDLNALCADGVYELAGVTPFDMFPQTQHVECVADLRRGKEPLPSGGISDSTLAT